MVQDVIQELRKQLLDADSPLRQGKYGARAVSLSVLSSSEIEALDQGLKETTQGQHWKDLADMDTEAQDEVCEVSVVIEPQSDSIPQSDSLLQQDAVGGCVIVGSHVDSDKPKTPPHAPSLAAETPVAADASDRRKSSVSFSIRTDFDATEEGNGAQEGGADGGPPRQGLRLHVSDVVSQVVHQTRQVHMAPAIVPTVERCRGTLLTISSEWSDAWKATSGAAQDDDDSPESEEDTWLGGTMSKRSPERADMMVQDDSLNGPLRSNRPNWCKEVPKFKPPRKIEAWGHRDVMPMHKTSLAVRQEKSREDFSRSLDQVYDGSEDEGVGYLEQRPSWFGRNPAQALPQKAPAFPPAQPVPPAKRNPYAMVVPGPNPPVSPLTRRQSRGSSHLSAGNAPIGSSQPLPGGGGALATDTDQVLSAEAQMQLGELLGEMLSAELGEGDDAGAEAHPVGLAQDWHDDSRSEVVGIADGRADRNLPGDDALLSELRRWRTPPGVVPRDVTPDPPGTGSANFPPDDRDAAGEMSNRLSWVPSMYARSDLLSKEHSRAFMADLNESLADQASMAPPRELALPAIAPAEKVSYKVGDTMRKKWQGYASMSEHERYSKFKKQAAMGVKRSIDKQQPH